MTSHRPLAVCDLDGVVWLGDQPIPGAGDAVAGLREGGCDVLFLTNNSSLTRDDVIAKLARAGVEGDRDEVLTSAMAAAAAAVSMLPRGAAVLAWSGTGVKEALEQVGFAVDPPGGADVDAVVVGWHRSFDFDELSRAAAAVRAGALFIATNRDATYPTPDGLLPGSGALVAAVATAAGREPDTVAGKPEPTTVELVRERARSESGFVVGDRRSSDGVLAERLGWPFLLVESEVTGTEETVGADPFGVYPRFDDAARALIEALDQDHSDGPTARG